MNLHKIQKSCEAELVMEAKEETPEVWNAAGRHEEMWK